jgi:4a-hydroxytetrahydrobiopterin dehydratase
MFIEKNNALHATFTFPNFTEAFAFMTQVAFLAEQMHHHPTFINTYNSVEIVLSTHDAGNIVTEKDTTMALAIEKLYQK